MTSEAWSNDRITIVSPSLPEGAATVSGMGEAQASAGVDGMAAFSVPLVLCSGRSDAPACTLHYSAAQGNSEWGMGWSLPIPRIVRSTLHGVPCYQDNDTFLSPAGEILVPWLNAQGQQEVRRGVEHFQGTQLDQAYSVWRYGAQVEHDYHRIERWQGEQNGREFWLIHASDGSLSCFGRTSQARIADESTPTHIGEWLLEEWLSAVGEHHCYHYRAEDRTGVSGEEQRAQGAKRYLQRIDYANIQPHAALYCWQDVMPAAEQFFLHVIFDYGERGLDKQQPPDWTVANGQNWHKRPDSFSHYTLGFEVRCHRLCQQILMFSRHPQQLDSAPQLTNRYLLTYQSDTVMSCLDSITRLAYQQVDGQMRMLEKAPLSFTMARTDSRFTASDYVPLPGWSDVEQNGGMLVDLWGEGYAGWLYQKGPIWGYQAPIRDLDLPGGIGYAPWQPLPQAPSFKEGNPDYLLVDMTGDGFLDWVALHPDLQGFFSLNAQGEWQGFTPFSAFPGEYFHPQSQFADLVGNGLLGIALIGPQTVRFYASHRDGYDAPVNIAFQEGLLPLPNLNDHLWVALANPLGSGSAHLVQVNNQQVTCWPGLGYGKFGKPLDLPLAEAIDDEAQFRTQHLYLVDIDGSGTDDLLYATAQGLKYYQNLSGNGFASPVLIPWPEGFVWDSLNALQFAPMSGQGISLVVSERHMAPRHWRLDWVTQRPWLLTGIDNHRGLQTQLVYRSSADYWLDEKQEDPQRRSQLPLRLSLLAATKQYDEIAQRSLLVEYRYRRGRYDTVRRRYCGYHQIERIEQTDARDDAGTPLQKPRLTRTWYHTGVEEDATRRENYFPSPGLNDSYLSHWRQESDEALPDALPDEVRQSMHFALNGLMLRQELYEATDTSIPFTVQEQRYQVRLLQENRMAVRCAPLMLETFQENGQKFTEDVARQQTVVMHYDGMGSVLHEVAIAYPRERQQERVPYPYVSDLQWQNTFDEAQYLCWFSETHQRWFHIMETERWCLQQADRSWQFSRQVPDSLIDGSRLLSREQLLVADSPIDPAQPRTLVSWRQAHYQQSGQQPDYPLRVTHYEQAVLNDDTLLPYQEHFTPQELIDELQQAGYRQRTLSELGQDIWLAESDCLTYLDAAHFYLPSFTDNSYGGRRHIQYDPWCMRTRELRDEFEQPTTVLATDYRFWQNVRIRDINQNISEIRLNAFGEVVARSFYGSESGKEVGFAPVEAFTLVDGLTLTQALAQVPQLLGDMASVSLSDETHYHSEERLPAWSLTLTARDYPGEKEVQPCQVAVTYYDGAGGVWQQRHLTEVGEAYLRDDQGRLRMEGEQLLQEPVAERWVLTLAPEHTLLGSQVRRYIPCFIDSPLPLWDPRLASLIPCEQDYCDVQLRPAIMQTAKGYLRWQRYFPWFQMYYDENDTLQAWISDDAATLYKNRVSKQLPVSGLRGELVDIQRQQTDSGHYDTQLYYLNAGERTYLPELRQAFTPGANLAEPYTLPGNPDYEIAYGTRELGIAFGVVSLVFSVVTVGAGFFLTTIVAGIIAVVGGAMGAVSAGLGIASYLVSDKALARNLAEASFWLGMGSLVTAGFGAAYHLALRSTGRVLQVTLQGGPRVALHTKLNQFFLRMPGVRPVIYGNGRRLPTGTLLQLHGSSEQTVNVLGESMRSHELAKFLVKELDEPFNNSQPIYLMSCHATNGDSASMAATLSKKWVPNSAASGIGRPVIAFDSHYTVFSRSSFNSAVDMSISGRGLFKEGESILFNGGPWGKLKTFVNGKSIL